jgi:hypothetical protein
MVIAVFWVLMCTMPCPSFSPPAVSRWGLEDLLVKHGVDLAVGELPYSPPARCGPTSTRTSDSSPPTTGAWCRAPTLPCPTATLGGSSQSPRPPAGPLSTSPQGRPAAGRSMTTSYPTRRTGPPLGEAPRPLPRRPRSSQYGYTRMKAVNATHLYLEQVARPWPQPCARWMWRRRGSRWWTASGWSSTTTGPSSGSTPAPCSLSYECHENKDDVLPDQPEIVDTAV